MIGKALVRPPRRLFAAVRIAVLIACSVAVIAGCGSDGDSDSVSDEDRAALESLTAELEAVAADKDPQAFCDIVQPTLVNDAFGSRAGCVQVISRALNDDFPLADLDIEQITTRGEAAIVKYAQDPPDEILFVQEDGQWYIALNELVLLQEPPENGS